MSDLLTYFKDQQQAIIDQLITLINFETPTRGKEHVDKMGAYMESQFNELGASSVTRFPQSEVGDMLLAKWNEDAPGKPIMFLIHIDTVWPIGTLAERPPYIGDDGKLYGPGAVDMKAGVALTLAAIRGLKERQEMPDRPIWVMMTSDEEVGSLYSRDIIIEAATQAGLVFVMEPGTPDGSLKTWRKGIATYRIDIEGLPSHAGNAPEKGINAITEFAQQVERLNKLNDYKRGTSVSVTMVEGGSATNVIPARLTAFVDTRSLTMQAWEDTFETMTHLKPFVPGAKVKVTKINGHKPMEHDEQMVQTFAQCKRIGESYGVHVTEDGSGGASDGNTVAAHGIPVLDGLGPQGDGLHALHEQVVIASLPTRATLLAGMLKDWQFE